MSNNRVIADLAQTLSTSLGGSIKVSNGSLISDTLTDSDYNGTPTSGFTDSSEVATVINTSYISQNLGSVRDSSGIKAYLQGNIGTSINPLTSATYDVGDSANPIDEIILDSSASIFFGALSLTSILKSGTSAIAVAAAASPVSGSAETSFLLKTDSTQTDAQVDASSNTFTITESGNIKSTALSPYHPKGYSTYFDGTGDYLTVSSSGSTIGGLSSFTVEGWYWPDPSSENSTYDAIYSCAGGLSTGYQTAGRLYNYNGDVGFYWNQVDQAWSYNGDWVAGAWNHFAVTYDGTTTKVYINGSEVISTTSASFSGTTDIQVSEPSYPAYGYISDFRISDSVIYTAAFTPPTERLTATSGTQLLTCHLPYLADASSNSFSIAVGGDTKTKVFSPYDHVAYSPSSHGGSVYFDGSGDYMSLPANDGYNFGSGDFTLEAWLYVDLNSISSNLPLVGWGTGSYKIIRLNSTGINVESNSPSNASFTVSFPSSPQTKTWNHIALVRSGNSFTAYLNGVGGTAYTSFTGNIGNGSDALNISYKSDPAYYTGYMSDLRIVKGTAVYTADFTPPTEPLTAISGTQLLTCTNKNSIYDAAAGQDVTATGDAAASTTQYKWSSSTTFDDNGDYLTATIDPPGTGDYTIECWVRFNSMGAGNQSILSFGTYSPAIYYRSASNELAVYFSSAFYLSGFTPVADTWYHIAWTRSGTSCRLFVDGVQKGTTASNAHNVTSSSLRIGYDGVDYFGGYIEDVRYTKGLARYTADFTPPAATFEG